MRAAPSRPLGLANPDISVRDPKTSAIVEPICFLMFRFQQILTKVNQLRLANLRPTFSDGTDSSIN